MNLSKLALLAALILSGCVESSGSVQTLLLPREGLQTGEGRAVSSTLSNTQRPVPQARTTEEVTYMTAKLNELQRRSISENREFCGLLGITASGSYSITPAHRGSAASCRPDNPPVGFRVIASYHTHAAFDPRYDGEVPSVTDMEGDINDSINGYISTPGGRVWFVDSRIQTSILLCGLSCVLADPRHREDQITPVANRYTLAALRARQR